MSKKKKSGIGTAVLLVISLILSGAVIGFLLLHTAGSSDKTIRSQQGRVSMDRLESRTETALAGLIREEEAPGPAPAEPQEAVRTVYTIPEGALVAPVPRREGYGTSADPTALDAVLAEASQYLDVGSLFFRTDVTIAPDTLVHWYYDPTILAICWTELVNDTLYTYSEAVVGHASQFRRFLAGGSFGAGPDQLTTEMSATVNAVVAASGDFYGYRGAAVISVHDGQVMRATSGWLDVCMVDYDGNLHMIPRKELKHVPDLEVYIENYVAQNNINFCIEFGPILYDHGPVEIDWDYPAGACGKGRARSAICQMGPLHYMVVDANVDDIHVHEPNIFEFRDMVTATGCEAAFALDGGQTASVAMDNKLINHVSYGSPRVLSDILYFATAMPSGD